MFHGDPDECVNTGDAAWVMVSTVLVLGMMPALAFFEAGLLRSRNAMSIVTQVLAGLSLMQVMWYLFGYSLVFDGDYAGLIGGVRRVAFLGLENKCYGHYGKEIPALAYALFEAMFASITPLLMTGAFAERVKFRPYIVFTILWELIVYYPMAHWVWGGGWLQQWGALDFAGGIVIHTTAGVGALVFCIVLGRRADYHEHHGEAEPHNLPLAAVGAALLWMGWYGFNAGSALTASSVAASTISCTTLAASVCACVWMLLAVIHERRVQAVVVMNGAIAGLAGITPISGYIETYWACAVAVVIGVTSFYGGKLLKHVLKVDDALEVTTVHGVPGVVGSLAIGLLASLDVNPLGANGAIHGGWRMLYVQTVAVLVAAVWAAVWTAILAIGIGFLPYMRLRPKRDHELKGLDLHEHISLAYHELYPGHRYEIEAEFEREEENQAADEESDLGSYADRVPLVGALVHNVIGKLHTPHPSEARDEDVGNIQGADYGSVSEY